MIKPLITVQSIVIPMDQSNIDTDAIIPKQYLTSIKRTGFGTHLFDQWRYQTLNNIRTEKPDFILNQSPYRQGKILLTRANFGCGSSREHAAWAIAQFGIEAIIAQSFADIFFQNATNNGIAAICLEKDDIDQLFKMAGQKPIEMTIDIAKKNIKTTQAHAIPFKIENKIQQKLLNGWDDIDLTLQKTDLIKNYEKKRKKQAPWLFEE